MSGIRRKCRRWIRKTRKLLTIYRTHHPQADVDRLYMKRSEGGRGLIGVEDWSGGFEQTSLKKYIHSNNGKWCKAVKDEGILKQAEDNNDSETIRMEHSQRTHTRTNHFMAILQNHRGSCRMPKIGAKTL